MLLLIQVLSFSIQVFSSRMQYTIYRPSKLYNVINFPCIILIFRVENWFSGQFRGFRAYHIHSTYILYAKNICHPFNRTIASDSSAFWTNVLESDDEAVAELEFLSEFLPNLADAMKSCEIMRRSYETPTPKPNLYKLFENIFLAEGYQEFFRNGSFLWWVI